MKKSSLLKSIFLDILNGYSTFDYDGKTVYYKHSLLEDEIHIDKVYEDALEKAKSKGAPTEEDRLKNLDESGVWTSEEEKNLNRIKQSTKTLIEQKSKLVFENQREVVDKTIAKNQSEIVQKTIERLSLIGQTCEVYAKNIRGMEVIKTSLFLDKDFNKKLFSEDEYDNISDKEMNSLIKCYNSCENIFSEKNLKDISVSDFFLQPISFMSEKNMYKAFSQNPFKLTANQQTLLTLGRFVIAIKENTKDIPDEVLSDFDKLYDWHIGNRRKQELINKTKDKGGVGVVGANANELKEIGGPASVSPFEMLKKSGKKTLSAKDFAQ